MARPMRERRGNELWCTYHKDWHHEREFRLRTNRHGGPTVPFQPMCREAEADRKRQVRNQDEALYIVRDRAKQVALDWNKANPDLARQCGAPDRISTEYVMSPDGLNYISKVIEVRAYLTWPREGLCKSCGHRYHERAKDYDPDTPKPERFQFDHIEPPRGSRDFARLHARNLQVLDKECNCGKNDQPHAEWLDDQAERQRIVVAHIAREEARFDLLAEPVDQLLSKAGDVVGDQLRLVA